MEIFFNAVRSQNGWSYNPTAFQVRSALKKLITYAGNGILASASANCIAKDTTSILKIDLTKATKSEPPAISNAMREHQYGSTLDYDMQMHNCDLATCRFCRGVLAYIGGYIAKSTAELLKCNECIYAILDSLEDPCPDASLISMKQYSTTIDFETTRVGLTSPSGSVFKMVMLAEWILRRNKRLIVEKDAVAQLINLVWNETRFHRSDFFATLKDHFSATTDGIDNHFSSLSKIILQKFFCARIDKILKDAKSGEASYLHRMSILCDKNKAQKNKTETLAALQKKKSAETYF